MTAQPPERLYSPDGRFWWDGTGWQPVDGPPPVPAQFQPPPGSAGQPPAGPANLPPGQPGFPGPGFPPPGNAIPRRPPRAGYVLALVGTLVASALVGGLAGGIAGAVSTEPPGIDAPPEFAAEFPTAEKQYLTGVTLDLVVENWMKKVNSFTCAEKDGDAEGRIPSKKVMECRPPDEDDKDYVTVAYDAADKIKSVTTYCGAGLKTISCRTLAGSMADAVLKPQGRQLRDQAWKWAEQNVDSERGTIIGGIRLTASLQPHSMTATPAA
jgi:hypothetical protein